MTDSPHTPRAHHPDIGRQLGVYRVLSVLGEGGMSRVYLAEHTRLGRKVALKRLKAPYAHRHAAVERFFAEAQSINRIRHPHIVDITDFEETDADVYCVMELLEGQTLARAIALEGALSPRRALRIAHQVAEALEAAHRVGVIHLDVKPANIFLTAHADYPDFVKLLDFGVALLDQEEGGEPPRSDPEIPAGPDHAGARPGTLVYMSPEQLAGHSVDARSDLYSLGVTLYEMLSGTPPFQAEGPAGYHYQHREVVPPSLHRRADLPAPVPAALGGLVDRCLAKDPARRYPSARALGDALASAGPEVGLSLRWGAPPVAVAPVGPVARRLRHALVAVLGLGVIAALVALAWDPQSRLEPKGRRGAPPGGDTPTRQVSLILETEPPAAQVVRLGPTRQILGVTPLRLRVPASPRPWAVEVLLPGYRPRRLEIPLQRDLRISLELRSQDDDPRGRARATRRRPAGATRRRAGPEPGAKDAILDPFR